MTSKSRKGFMLNEKAANNYKAIDWGKDEPKPIGSLKGHRPLCCIECQTRIQPGEPLYYNERLGEIVCSKCGTK